MTGGREQKAFGEITELSPTTTRNLVTFAPPEAWQAALRAAKDGRPEAEVVRPFRDWIERTHTVNTDLGDLYASWKACVTTVMMAINNTKKAYDQLPEPLHGAQLNSFLESKLANRLNDGTEPNWWSNSITAAATMMKPEIIADNREFEQRQAASQEQRRSQWKVTKMVCTRTPTGIGDAEAYRITIERNGTRKAVDLSFGYDPSSAGIHIGFAREGLENRINGVEERIVKALKRKGVELTETRAHDLAEQIVTDVTARERRDGERMEH